MLCLLHFNQPLAANHQSPKKEIHKMKRQDDFEKRSKHLKDLSDEALYDRFWELANQIVEPMLELGKKNTTPAIERSILLRMGFSSIEAGPIVDAVIEKGLMGKGAGHVVWKLSQKRNVGIRDAGLMIIDGKEKDWSERLF